jgi:hypothetical protein
LVLEEGSSQPGIGNFFAVADPNVTYRVRCFLDGLHHPLNTGRFQAARDHRPIDCHTERATIRPGCIREAQELGKDIGITRPIRPANWNNWLVRQFHLRSPFLSPFLNRWDPW